MRRDGFQAAGVGALASAADVSQLGRAVFSLDEGRLKQLCKGGIGTGGVNDGAGFYADVSAGFFTAEADGNHRTKGATASLSRCEGGRGSVWLGNCLNGCGGWIEGHGDAK